MLKKLTPILFVDAIEPSLSFWVDRLGFEKTVEVPEGDRLGFVILNLGAIELMLQTFESLAKDMPGSDFQRGGCLYLEVTDFQGIVEALEGSEVVVPPRKTWYGADEIFVREPGGNLVGFAAHPAE